MRRDVVIAGALYALSIALNLPLIESGESRYRDSIAGGYASMARFFHDHPNPWGWNRLEYGGLASQFTYLPGLPYAAAAAMEVLPGDPGDAYPRVAALFALAAPPALFLFVLYATGSRRWAIIAALVFTFCSPIYGLIHAIGLDRGQAYLPWRLQVLVKYGEGPHNAGLTLLILALLAAWRAARGRSIVPSAILLAAVALTNWIAALALAIAILLLLAAMHGDPGFRSRRVIQSGVLGYGLACFWLTPAFVRTIAFNWPQDAFNYQLEQRQQWMLAGAVAGIALLRAAFHFVLPAYRYLCFVCLCFTAFCAIVVTFYSTGIAIIPEARRYALEFEMFLLLAILEYLRLTLTHANSSLRAAALLPGVFLLLAAVPQVRTALRQGFEARHPIAKETTIEWKLAAELNRLRPVGRVYASGGLRFRLNSWFPIEQAGGVFESGLTDRSTLKLAYDVREAPEPARVLDALRRLDVEYVVVHGPRSREHYRDFRHPQVFDAALQRVFATEDDRIYRVPFERRWRWTGPSSLALAAPAPVETIRVRYEPGWTATTGSLRRGADGWIELRGARGPTALTYRPAIEQWICAAISLLSALLAAWLVFFNRSGRQSPSRSPATP